MSKFRQIVAKGHKKVGFNKCKGKLLMSFSEDDHRRIALLIARWLDETESLPQAPYRESPRRQ